MSLREAILKAADHIEGNPGRFAFMSTEIPEKPHCGTPGCALGWVGYFAKVSLDGRHPLLGVRKVAGILFPDLPNEGEAERAFYCQMNAIGGSRAWQDDPAICAKTLRLYAEKYFLAEPQSFPAIEAELNRIFSKVRMAA